MNARTPESFTAEALQDPSIPAQTLADVAAVRPDLWQAVLAHPNCYQGLSEWITAQLPVAAAPEQQTPEPQASEPQTPKQPTTEQQAPEQPTPAQPRYGQPATDQSAQYQAPQYQEPHYHEEPQQASPQQGAQPVFDQIADGARSAASQTQQFFTQNVAPATTAAAQQVHQRLNLPAGTDAARSWLSYALAGAGVLLFFSCFMPMLTVNMFGVSAGFGFFSGQGPGGGIFLVLLAILTVAAGVVYIIMAAPWARLTAAIIAMVAGVTGLIIFVALAINSTGEFGMGEFGMGVRLSAGSFIMLLMSLATAAAGVLMLVMHKMRGTPATQQATQHAAQQYPQAPQHPQGQYPQG